MEDAQEDRSPGVAAGGYVFYDGECEMCRAAADRFRRPLDVRGFQLVPYQTPWVAERTGQSLDALAKDMCLLTADETLLRGIDAHAYLARTFWWARPFAALVRIPGLRQVLQLVYRLIASNRVHVTRCAAWVGLTAAAVIAVLSVAYALTALRR